MGHGGDEGGAMGEKILVGRSGESNEGSTAWSSEGQQTVAKRVTTGDIGIAPQNDLE